MDRKRGKPAGRFQRSPCTTPATSRQHTAPIQSPHCWYAHLFLWLDAWFLFKCWHPDSSRTIREEALSSSSSNFELELTHFLCKLQPQTLHLDCHGPQRAELPNLQHKAKSKTNNASLPCLHTFRRESLRSQHTWMPPRHCTHLKHQAFGCVSERNHATHLPISRHAVLVFSWYAIYDSCWERYGLW